MPLPARPGVNQLETKQAFRRCIAEGVENDTAALACGVSCRWGQDFSRSRWHAADLVGASLGPLSIILGTLGDRAAAGAGSRGTRDCTKARSVAVNHLARMGRNAASRSGALTYRAALAQWKAERADERPKTAKLAGYKRLRTYVRNRPAGAVADSLTARGGRTRPRSRELMTSINALSTEIRARLSDSHPDTPPSPKDRCATPRRAHAPRSCRSPAHSHNRPH